MLLVTHLSKIALAIKTMSIKNKETRQQDINNRYPDNISEEITPAILREDFNDDLDSLQFQVRKTILHTETTINFSADDCDLNLDHILTDATTSITLPDISSNNLDGRILVCTHITEAPIVFSTIFGASSILKGKQFLNTTGIIEFQASEQFDTWFITIIRISPESFAFAYDEDNVAETVINMANVYETLNISLTSEDSTPDFTINTDNIVFTGTALRKFAVDIALAGIKSSGGSEEYNIALFVNSVRIKGKQGVSLSVLATVSNNLAAIISLQENDVVTVKAAATTSTKNLIVADITMKFIEIT